MIISVRATSPAARWTSTVPRHVLESAPGAVADIGLRIAVEAFAWSAINSVPTTSALLARANASNAGHLLDVWHFYNTGSTTRIDHRPRRRNRRRCATQRRPPRARLLPGGGDLDVRGFVTAVKSIGYDGPFSIESSYPEFRELDIAEAAALAFDATMKFF